MVSAGESSREKILVHVCCAPCATHVIELLSQYYAVTAFFYNPNIWPEEEYVNRLKSIERFCAIKGTELVLGIYEYQQWMERAGVFQNEPEGGKRCEVCFLKRLEKTAFYAVDNDFKFFATTLSISPHKNAQVINRVGKEVGNKYGVGFLEKDFKEGNGYKKSCEMSRQYGLYRQNYCGCLYSKKY